MDLRKFFAYFTLAIWIAFTAVTVNSANEWLLSKSKLVELQESLDWIVKQVDAIKGNDPDALQRLNRAQKDLASTQTALLTEIGRENVHKKAFESEVWWWLVLTLLVSALWASTKRI
jgi:uncharacterized membrane protein (DUF106 family)